MSPRTEQVSIYLRYISGGLTKETFIGYSLRPSKTGTAIVHYYFFSLAGPRDNQVVVAIRTKLGLTPQMDVRPYAYGRAYNDLGDDVQSKVLKFADDTKLYTEVTKEEGGKQLQDDLDKCTDWAKQWTMDFNVTKCKVLHAGRTNRMKEYTREGKILDTWE